MEEQIDIEKLQKDFYNLRDAHNDNMKKLSQRVNLLRETLNGMTIHLNIITDKIESMEKILTGRLIKYNKTDSNFHLKLIE